MVFGARGSVSRSVIHSTMALRSMVSRSSSARSSICAVEGGRKDRYSFTRGVSCPYAVVSANTLTLLRIGGRAYFLCSCVNNPG